MAVTDSPGAGRVLVALSGGPLAAEPTWTRFDNVTGSHCAGFDCESGRQSELDITDTGTARVYFHDETGDLDDDSLIGKQIMLQLYNPVADEWQPRWRGHIDDINHDLHPEVEDLATVQFECVDVFDYLGGARFVPGMGDSLPTGMSGVVFYEDENVDDRIIALLTDANIASTMRVVFTGNVDLNETLYDYDNVILQGLRDAADAEFPGVANVYVDRFGRVVFHGRFARFDPETVEAGGANWDFTRWTAATREDVGTTFAQIREFAFNRPRDRIINSYVAWPRKDENGVMFDQADVAALVQTDATSITNYGYRGRDATDLIIKSNINNSNTGAEECALFGEFYVENYAVPRKAIQRIKFQSLAPDDPRASSTWALMCKADISDAINLTVDEAGLSDVPFFIDGLSVSCRVLNASYDMVEVIPNLTPASYYGTDVFNP